VNISENIRIAIYSIRTNLLRSLLTMLGIIIGVSAVIAIITLGTGGRDYIINMIRDTSQNAVSITVNTRRAGVEDYITKEDIDAIKKLDSVEYISPVVINVGSARAPASDASSVAIVISGTADLPRTANMPVENGSFFSEEQYNSNSPVATISKLGATMLFGNEAPIGEYVEVTLNNSTVRFRIIGVVDLQSMGGMAGDSGSMFDMAAMGGGDDVEGIAVLAIPSSVTDIMTGNDGRYDTCYLTAVDERMLDTAGEAAKNTLYSRHQNYNPDKEIYMVVKMASLIDILDAVISIFTTFIASVSAISLIVGGIGVMNIMLVSVTERTREIGIRKALGARTGTIMFQFLTESVILCAIGGVIGMILGSMGAKMVAMYLNVPIGVKLSTVLLGVGFSSAIGIFFGIYPARRAAKMHPIEALRRE